MVEQLERALGEVINARRAPVGIVYRTLIRMAAQSCLHLTAGGLEERGRPFTRANVVAAAEGSLWAFTDGVREHIAQIAPAVFADMKRQDEEDAQH